MNTEILEAKQVKVIGYTTEYNFCECCGKENLKGTIALEINGNIAHYGTTCAYNQNKYDTLEAAATIKKEVKSLVSKRNKLEMQYFNSVYMMLKYHDISYPKKENGGSTNEVVAHIQKVVDKAMFEETPLGYKSYPRFLELWKEFE